VGEAAGEDFDREQVKPHHVCPWWLGYILASPLRRLFESPERLLSPYVQPGMTVVEPGCGMGFFTLPLARMVGPKGRVVCADIEPRMISSLVRRARRAGLADRIHPVVCTGDDLGLSGFDASADLAVALHMVHEVPDQSRLFVQLHAVLRPGGRLIVIEPRGHVSEADFARSLDLAARAGFERTDGQVSRRRLSVVLAKPGG
jgi:ubiquinone/menaquinone biosynthesis C-methylase UbiE